MGSPDIDSAAGFRAAVAAAIREALDGDARRVVLSDPDFDGWPLEETGLLESLADFLRQPGRQVVLIARRFDDVQRSCPRFVRWRQTWGHAIDARRPVDEAAEVPSLVLVDSALAIELLDKSRWRGRLTRGAAANLVRVQDFDAWAQRTEPSFSATTLGL